MRLSRWLSAKRLSFSLEIFKPHPNFDSDPGLKPANKREECCFLLFAAIVTATATASACLGVCVVYPFRKLLIQLKTNKIKNTQYELQPKPFQVQFIKSEICKTSKNEKMKKNDSFFFCIHNIQVEGSSSGSQSKRKFCIFLNSIFFWFFWRPPKYFNFITDFMRKTYSAAAGSGTRGRGKTESNNHQ